MNKLQYKDIASYLPNNLQVVYGKKQKRWVISSVISHETVMLTSVDGKDSTTAKIADLIPVLHPMGDMIKYITIQGYNDNDPFPPLFNICEILNFDNYGGIYTTSKILHPNEISFYIWGSWIVDLDYNLNVLRFEENNSVNITFEMSIQIINLFNQWRFDYRNLIGQGLAVDINTLNNES